LRRRKDLGLRHAWESTKCIRLRVQGWQDDKRRPARTGALAKTNVESLAEFEFFTFAKQAAQGEVQGADDVTLEANDKKIVTLRFLLPLETLSRRKSLFHFKSMIRPISSPLASKNKIPSPGKGACGCSLSAMDPSPAADENKKLSEAFFQNFSPGADFGIKLAPRDRGLSVTKLRQRLTTILLLVRCFRLRPRWRCGPDGRTLSRSPEANRQAATGLAGTILAWQNNSTSTAERRKALKADPSAFWTLAAQASPMASFTRPPGHGKRPRSYMIASRLPCARHDFAALARFSRACAIALVGTAVALLAPRHADESAANAIEIASYPQSRCWAQPCLEKGRSLHCCAARACGPLSAAVVLLRGGEDPCMCIRRVAAIFTRPTRDLDQDSHDQCLALLSRRAAPCSGAILISCSPSRKACFWRNRLCVADVGRHGITTGRWPPLRSMRGCGPRFSNPERRWTGMRRRLRIACGGRDGLVCAALWRKPRPALKREFALHCSIEL